MKVVRGLVAGAVLAMAGTASAASLEGTVYVDDNGDGVLSATDTTVAEVVVSYRGTLFTTTDADGHYVLEIPDGDGIVWASVPDGFVAGPLWQKVSAQGDVIVTADLALTRSEHTGPLSFVVGSDSHFGAKGVDSDALTRAMAQLDLSPPANFVTIVGDITQANHPDQFDEVTAAAATLSAPFVPVAGNHDWYDGGASYREHLGPDHYSFNAQGVHFLVMNHNAPLSSWETFLANDLSFVPDDTILVAFTHAPPTDPYRDLLIASGIDYLFTGHWHTNLVFDHGSMLEYNTQTLVMGGIDFSPAGFRVVTFQDGVPVVTHHTIVEHPVTSVVFPRKDACVDGQPFTVIAAAELGAAAAHVTARIDGGDAIDLSATGGWTYSAKAPILSPGMHQLTIHATSATGGNGTAERTFSVCEEPPTGDFTVADWTQHQGGPRHHGFSSHAITTPLSLLWTRTVGGHIQGGSVAVADG
ncbi:MAG TPA: metallophosphoesterase, partial [Kofleriaceae bacterium]|nr:metallophosphoesterase [Kofleriaceae bacterium]